MNTFQKWFTGTAMCLLLLASTATLAQKDNRNISSAEKKMLMDTAFTLLRNHYIFPEKIIILENSVRQKLARGDYAGLVTVSSFLKQMNSDMETLTNDRHVNIFYDPIRVKQIQAESKSSSARPSFNPEFLKKAKFENYMVRKTERLDGNVGYLKLDLFLDIRLSKPTLVAAMNFLSNSSALILDLRQNGGGHASTVNFLLNYFIPDSTLTSRFTSRLTKTTTNIYTEHDDLIQKFAEDVPVYILVGKRTSSAAEAFAYTLQAFKRATIIGDTTNGEANPGYAFSLNEEMWIMVPTSVNANPVTKTNWQGIGVIPDKNVRPEMAFNAGLAAAYQQLGTRSADPELKRSYEWLAVEFNAKAYPVKPDDKEWQVFTGAYADQRQITMHQQQLFYQRVGIGEKKKLIPLSGNLFELEGSSFFRVRFIKNEKGDVVGLEGIYDDGKTEQSKRLGNL